MKYTKKWMVVPFVEEEENNTKYSKLERIVKQDDITEDQRADLYNNTLKKKSINQMKKK